MTVQYKGRRARVAWEYFVEFSQERETSQPYTYVYIDGWLATKIVGRLTGKQIKRVLGC